ncbi:DUF3107 domain-containing protein [Streptomyces profundus]|nr:DUF3107 domain-containing protein [Streptomyces sp. MA3_2.13]
MEIKIGVQHTPREIVLDSGQSAEEVESAVADALSGTGKLLTLVDVQGRKVVVPGDRLAYVEIGRPTSRRLVCQCPRLRWVPVVTAAWRRFGCVPSPPRRPRDATPWTGCCWPRRSSGSPSRGR